MKEYLETGSYCTFRYKRRIMALKEFTFMKLNHGCKKFVQFFTQLH